MMLLHDMLPALETLLVKNNKMVMKQTKSELTWLRKWRRKRVQARVQILSLCLGEPMVLGHEALESTTAPVISSGHYLLSSHC